MQESRSESGEQDVTPAFLADVYCSGNPLSRRLLEAKGERVRLAQGEVLFEQGDPGDGMYLLLQGRLEVRLRLTGGETRLSELEPGAMVGEMALLTGQARTATVCVLEDAELIRCGKEGFDLLVEQYPQERAGFASAVYRRLQEVQVASTLAEIFGALDTTELQDLQAETEWVSLSRGEALFHMGDPGEAMYVVISGRLRVTIPLPDGGEHIVGEIAPGETVGEMALLSGEPRSATVTAIRETNVVRLARVPFERLVEHHPRAMMNITRLIVQRQQQSLRVSPPGPTRALSLALIPAGPGVPLAQFAQQLAKSLGAFGGVLHLDSRQLDGVLGREGSAHRVLDEPTDLVLRGWLSEQETAYRYILYEAEADWSPWTQRCVRQADRLLIIGQGETDPTPGPVEAAMLAEGFTTRRELVLLHPAHTTQPRDTSCWLAERQVDRHHHLRGNEPSHLRRLARRLTAQAVGLVLSGGGARGFAHLGVLRAIEELGIEIDLVGGTSMGALIGGAYARGLSHRDVVDAAREMANPRRLFDYTLPFVSLMATAKITGVVRELLGEGEIEDLWRPYYCLSSNLARAEPVVHERGPLWKAVRASIAIPGVFSPVLYGGDLLVDGGIMNNLPVDLMQERVDRGAIIGVNASPPREKSKAYDFGDSVSGWHVLWSRVNPLARRMRVPSIVGTLMRTMEINSVHRIRATQGLADLMIQPDVERFGILDFAAYEPIIEAGYRTALAQLAEWQGQRVSSAQA